MNDIAIVGMDCRFPQAPSAGALWRLLLDGQTGITEVPADRWRADDYYDPAGGAGKTSSKRGGFIADADVFDHEFFAITPREAALMDPQQRLLLHAAWRALEDATLDPRSVAGSSTGVFIGVMANEWANLHMSDYAEITAQHGSGNGYFMTANRLSYHLDLKGPSMAIDTACSSSLVAVHLACAALRAGECDQSLAAGVNLVLTPAVNIFYTQAGLTAADGQCKPFSGEADGIGRGEGVAVLVLRRLADAQADALPIYAVIEGGAVNSDGRSNGLTAPNRWAQQQVVATAYERAGVRPEQISFIEAHGTGTVLGDMIEVKSLGELHRVPRPALCGIGSIKGNLGHTEGAAGVAALIKVALSLHHRVVPPTRFADQENPRLRLAESGLRLLAEPLELPAGDVHASVSSFGIGGSNAHLVLRSAPAVVEVAGEAGVGIVTVSANNREGLQRAASTLANGIANAPDDRFAQLCWSSNQIKASGRHRLAVVAPDAGHAIAALRRTAADESALRDVAGVARGVVTGWMFTGQGSQHPGMSRTLSEHCAAYRNALADVDEAMAPHLGRSVRALLFSEDPEIQNTEFAQPAIFAMEYALARVLAEIGIEPAWLIGHSVGEFAAAVHAGVLELDDACKLIVARGRLVQALPAGGVMVAVRATVAEALEVIDDSPLVALGAVNGPRDVVLSGAGAAVSDACERLVERGATTTPLGVTHAFHSRLMEPAVEALAAVASELEFRPPRLPIFSTVRGRPLDVDEPMDAGYWVEQLVSTVRFGDALLAALESDPTHLIEVGPRRILAPLVARVGAERPPPVLVPCPGLGATGLELHEAIAALYREGLDPMWDALYEPGQRVRRRLAPYEFSTEHRSWVQASGVPAVAAAPVQPATVPAATEPAVTEPAANEPDEETTMDQIVALFREQAAVLAAFASTPGGAVPTGVAGALDRSAAGRSPAAANAHNVIGASLIAEIARVSGFPEDALDPGQTLAADLGFDSIMLNELVGRLTGALPACTIEPGIFETDITIGYLADHLGAQLGLAPDVPPQAVPEQHRIEEFPEVVEVHERIRLAPELGLDNPYFLINDGITRDTSIIGGVEVVNFSSYNYLGMSGHPAVTAAVQDAVARYGSSCSSSRLLSGEKPVHQELEAELAALHGVDAALAFVSGHATNVTVIAHMVGPSDLVIHDALAHNSIVQGGELSGATRRPFPHNDAAALDAILGATRHQYRRVLVVIEGAYSQDGDIADLPALIEVKRQHRALMMVDEAHSIAVLGAGGGGVGEHFGVDRSDVELWFGTLSKSLASCGGYIAGSDALIRFLKYTAPGFIFSAGISPPNAAAALAALRQMKAEPETLAALRRNSELFRQLAIEAGVDIGESCGTPIIPCIVGDSLKALRLSNALLRRGINVNPILYPAVPEELARLRFFMTAAHSEDQIRSGIKILSEELALLNAAS